MYFKIINEINSFLENIGIGNSPINPLEFQAVFVKKLSNQNIIRDKRRIKSGSKSTTINQTHIDVTGQTGMLFFFKKSDNNTTDLQEIDIDLFYNNFSYLKDIDVSQTILDSSGNTILERKTSDIPAQYSVREFDKILHSSAYKKYGHTGNQVQINIPDSTETFTQFQHFAFQDDALIFLRYDYFHYLSILIPSTLSTELYKLTNTLVDMGITPHTPTQNRTCAINAYGFSLYIFILYL